MDNGNPLVSIIVPCRNEEIFIGLCLESIIANDYPKENLEVLVIDGMSEDRTREIVKKYMQKYQFVILLDNIGKIVPKALNLGLQNAKGNIIIRMDAHTQYEKEYINKCVKYLLEYDVDNVGGICLALPSSNTLTARAIALAISHPFGVGNAYFRIGAKEPKYVDTVPFGCYRREIFERIGLFDEDLVRNQDDEFNLRLLKNGGKTLLVSDIVSYYHTRDSLSKLWKMFYQYGYFKPLVAKKVGAILTWRQLIPAIFSFSLILFGIFSLVLNPFWWIFLFILILYTMTNLIFSFYISTKRGFPYFFFLPIIFLTLHLSYGISYLKGIWDFIILDKQKRTKIVDIPLTR